MIKKETLRVELIAGLTTFLTMAYIIFVNPQILEVTGMSREALVIVTCLVSGIVTLLSGLLTNTPVAMAPGMGLNAFFAYTLVLGNGISWQTALGIVFISGLFFFILSVFGFRKKLASSIPDDLLYAVSVGIGIFITFIGLQQLGIVVRNEATMVAAGKISFKVLLGLIGLIVMITLQIKKVKGGMLLGILLVTLLGYFWGDVKLPEKVSSLKFDISSLFGKLDIIGALKFSFLGSIFSLMFIDLFDSLGTLLACLQESGIKDKKEMQQKLNRLLIVDAGATMFGAVAGTSTTTSYIESAAGIESGGRSGLTAIFCGLVFLLAIPFAPLIAVVPGYATAPALIMVGYFMIRNIRNIDFSDVTSGIPAFLIIVMIALSYSISFGLAFGFVSYALIKVIGGRIREIPLLFWVIVVLSVIFLIV